MGASQTNVTPGGPLATLAARSLSRVPSTQIARSAAGSRRPRSPAVGPGSRPAELRVVAAAEAAEAAAAAAVASMAAMAAVAAVEGVLAVMAAAAAAVAVSVMAVLVPAAAAVVVVAAVTLEEDRGLLLAQSPALSMSHQRWQQLLLPLLLLLLLAVLSIPVGPLAPSASEDTRDHVRQVFERLGWDVKQNRSPPDHRPRAPTEVASEL